MKCYHLLSSINNQLLVHSIHVMFISTSTQHDVSSLHVNKIKLTMFIWKHNEIYNNTLYDRIIMFFLHI